MAVGDDRHHRRPRLVAFSTPFANGSLLVNATRLGVKTLRAMRGLPPEEREPDERAPPEPMQPTNHIPPDQDIPNQP